jgi:sodium pump decarboxylase gamma subunit
VEAANSAGHAMCGSIGGIELDPSTDCEAFMIVEGIKLAIIGIIFVYIFLSLLVWVMHLSARILSPYTQQEQKEQMLRNRRTSAGASLKDGRLAAVIGAAITAHRKSAQRRTWLRG